MKPQIISKPSPNYDERPDDAPIDTLVLHYTDTGSAQESLNILCDKEKKVSAHYLIDEDGTIYQLVQEEKQAWHAGISYWRGREKLNAFSIGIEIQNPGHRLGYHAFPEEQMQSVIKLCKDIVLRYSIKSTNVIAHSDIAPERKKDPGELFDWQRLANEGISIWHGIEHQENVLVKMDELQVKVLQKNLAKIGYKIEETGRFDKQTERVVIAFQRRFLPIPRNITGKWGTLEDKIVQELVAKQDRVG